MNYMKIARCQEGLFMPTDNYHQINLFRFLLDTRIHLITPYPYRKK